MAQKFIASLRKPSTLTAIMYDLSWASSSSTVTVSVPQPEAPLFEPPNEANEELHQALEAYASTPSTHLPMPIRPWEPKLSPLDTGEPRFNRVKWNEVDQPIKKESP